MKAPIPLEETPNADAALIIRGDDGHFSRDALSELKDRTPPLSRKNAENLRFFSMENPYDLSVLHFFSPALF